MFFRESNREFEQQREERNRRRLKALVDAGEPVGLLAYDRGEPVEWASLGPRPTLERLRRSPLLVGDFADPSTWSLLCFYVHPDARHRGIAHALLDVACAHASSEGTAALKAMPRTESGRCSAAELDVDTRDFFASHGFEVVGHRRRASRVVMRRDLR